MSDLINYIEQQKKRFTGKVETLKISEAESLLSLKISEEYKEVLEKYGSLMINGEEFLGLGDDSDIVSETLMARKEDTTLPSNLYVIENMHIDGFLLLQDENGVVYSYSSGLSIKRINNNLLDYLKSL